MSDTDNTNTAAAMAAKLAIVVNLLDAHPDLPRPCVFAYGKSGSVEVTWQLVNGEPGDDQRALMQQIVAAIGGTWDKKPWDDRFDLERYYEGIKLEIYAHRDQVCERVVVGTETITIPAEEARPAVPALPERTEVVEVVEWRCAPLLGERATEAVSR